MSSKREKSPVGFVATCDAAFGFLVRECGFSGPEIDTSQPGIVLVRYKKERVGVECVFEERDDDVAVKIIRLESGQAPSGYRRDDDGAVIREYLTRLLLRRGIRDLGLTTAQRAATHLEALEGYARLLRDYAPDVIEGENAILNES